MRLICVGSSSQGNAYALDAGNEILLLEAGCKLANVKRAIDFKLSDVVGCVISHVHGDHCKYAPEYAKFGINLYGPQDIASKKQFPFEKFRVLDPEKTVNIGGFCVTPFEVAHDVPCFGYLIMHLDMGILMFVTDTFKVPTCITGIDHYLIEANYCDDMLKQNVWDGKIIKSQADRIMLSHMSLQYTIKYLQDCRADETAKTITLCHLSERNSEPERFRSTVAGAFGVPTYIAEKNVVVKLNNDII